MMPKGYVETDHVNKDVFMQVLKLKKTSIRRLDEEPSIECSDKTIRRSLNNGKMRRQYIEQIAKYLDVDSRLLTGELVEGAFHTTNSVVRKLYLNPLTHIKDFPYFREEQERLQREKIDETLKRILSLFEISYKQFEEKDFEEQYSFQHDLFVAILPIIYKHFKQDGYGDAEMYNCQRIISELEDYHDLVESRKYADNILRKHFIKSVPEGYTKTDIERMTPDELIEIDAYLQIKENDAR
ncbi:MAG: hypothetical protein ACLT5W_13350 [Ruminococcus sp.]